MPRLTDEEREKLPLGFGSSWADDGLVQDAYLDNVRVDVDHKNSRAALIQFQEGVTSMFVADALAVITAAGLNPWYERCRHLETELTALQERHRIAMKAWGSHLGLEPDS